MENQNLQLLVNRLLEKSDRQITPNDQVGFLAKAIPVVLGRAMNRLLDQTRGTSSYDSLQSILENQSVEEGIKSLEAIPGAMEIVEQEIDTYAEELSRHLEN